MSEFEFSVVLCDQIDLDEHLEDNVYSSDCSDCQLSSIDGRVLLMFEREAATFTDAVFGVLTELRAIGLAHYVRCIDPSDLVSQIQIGKRLGKKRQQIHQYINGLRGPGNFPKPIRYTEERKPVWSWVRVLGWFLNENLLGVNSIAVQSACEASIINGFLATMNNRKLHPTVVETIENRFGELACNSHLGATVVPWSIQEPVDICLTMSDHVADVDSELSWISA